VSLRYSFVEVDLGHWRTVRPGSQLAEDRAGYRTRPSSRSAASASARSSQGSCPAPTYMVRSWPLPASRTTSPGRAAASARLLEVDRLQPAPHPREGRESGGHLLKAQAQGDADAGGAERVGRVEPRGHGQVDAHLLASVAELEARGRLVADQGHGV